MLKAYNQDEWAKLPDAGGASLQTSLAILKGLHARWCLLWDNLRDADWSRVGLHPESGEITPDSLLQTYSRHGESHIEQIKKTLAAKKS